MFPYAGLVLSLLVALVLVLSGDAPAGEDVLYSVAFWPRERGNHRALVAVSEAGDAVRVHIPWRRRDPAPETKAVRVFATDGDLEIENVVPVNVSQESGDLVFQPSAGPGVYELYYMPYRHSGPHHQFATEYTPPDASAVDAAWVARHHLSAGALEGGAWRDLPEATVTAIQARTEFDRMDPMEVIATADEVQRLLAEHPGQAYLVFPEDRRHPIRMTDHLPLCWVRRGPANAFSGQASRGEFYVFQLGVYAAKTSVDDLDVRCEGLDGLLGFRCINLGGTDWLGRAFEKEVSVPLGRVQALWCGVSVPTDARPGRYEGVVRLSSAKAGNTEIALALDVAPERVEDGGVDELWRQARLMWLDSSIGLDDDVVAPYIPLVVDGQTVACLGRTVRFAGSGLPESIQSGGHDLLARPVAVYVETARGRRPWRPGRSRVTKETPGTVEWTAEGEGEGFSVACQATMQFDGYLDFRVALTAGTAGDVADIGLEIPLRRDAATYMMGMGRKGGRRPEKWEWKWDVSRANNSLWIGGVEAGLHCKLKDTQDTWNLYNFHDTGLPQPWANDGKGGCVVLDNGPDEVLVRAYTGPRRLAAGETLTFCFGLLITPVKPLDPRHWNWRYQHQYVGLGEIGASGANIINIHHGNALNPHINYPFNAVDALRDYVHHAHEKNVKVKIYYTVRELSNHCAELWALRSLGHEVFTGGRGGGYSWPREHLVDDYAAAWHEPNLPGGDIDGAIRTTGLSRWHNYYLEGLGWLLENAEIDGLYLDGIGYNRVVMQRLRKVMERSRPGSLIDFHSGNNFHPNYGLSNCANQYLEHFPYIDSLWFGEGFDYNEGPDYWLVEISGIPFGLFGEMLQGGGNPWRGMIYGMTSRYGWGGDPREIWKVWDAFGIQDVRMIGYWNPASPVRTNHDRVLATAYTRPGKALIALASWADELVDCRLHIDWKAVGLEAAAARLDAPPVAGFQEGRTFDVSDAIPVQPGRGWLLVLE